MTKDSLSIKIALEKNTNNSVGITQKIIKTNIINQMNIKHVSIIDLHKKTNINVCILIMLLHCPFLKIRLSHAIKICKALELNISSILV